ncbi:MULTISPECIES: phage tail length tape measure family protein [unclassified Mesorhizobium]|uniref:phage tail length tape measure family protein n=1 Tax=unclassified Mesorhizobium TaxID=325217 RepID=UPI0030145214
MADNNDDILISVSTDLTSIKRQLRQLGQDIDATTSGIRKKFDGVGQGIDRSMTTALQSRINDMVGIASKGTKEWGGALADQGKALEQLRAKYSPLFAAQQTYLANLRDIKTAHAIGAISANEMASAVMREKASFAGNVVAINSANNVLKKAEGAAKLTANQMLNLSRQGNDVITMFALGAPPMQIFASQAGQIYDALESGPNGIKGSLKAIGESVMGLVARFPLATAAIVAAGAALAAYQFLAEDKVKTVDEVLKTHEENIKRLGPAYEEALKAAQMYSNESAALANLRLRGDADDALKRRSADAQTSIENIVRAEGVFSSRFSGAKDAIDAFIASIKAGNPEAIKFQETIAQLALSGRITEKVAQDLKAASDEAYSAEQSLRGVSGSVNEAAKAIADMADALGRDVSSRLSQLSDEQRKYVEDLIDRLKSGKISADQFKDALAALSGITPDFSGAIAEISGLADQLERAQRAALGLAHTTPTQDRVGFNRMDDAQSKYDDALTMWRRFGYDNDSKLDPNKSKKTKTPRTKAPAKTADDRFFEDIEAIRQRTAALAQETAMVGASFEAQTKRKTAFDLEQQALKQVREEARKKGDQDWQNAKLTDEQIAKINEVSDAYARQAEALRKAEEAQQDLQEWMSVGRDATRGFIDDLISGASAGDAFANVLKKIGDQLLELAMNDLFGRGNGNGFGLIGQLFGIGGGGGGGFASGGSDPWAGLRFDKGGYTGPGGKYQPAGIVHKGEYVFDAETTKRIGVDNLRKMQGYANGGLVGAPSMPRIHSPANQNNGPSMTFAPVIDARGADAAAVDRLQKVVAKQQMEFESRVKMIVKGRPNGRW